MPPRRPSPLALAAAAIGAGFTIIAASWFAAAGRAFVDEQLPFLVGGTATGTGFIVLGAALLVIEHGRRGQQELHARFDALGVERAAASNGHDARVVARRTLFHHPECRMVAPGPVETVPREQAVAAGLSACRVCRP